MGSTSNSNLIMISHQNIRSFHQHKHELQAFLEDHSPDVVTLNETMTKDGYKYNLPNYTAMTNNRPGNRNGGGVAILLRKTLAYEEVDNITLTQKTDNEQLTVAIRVANNQKLFISTLYCPSGHPSMELIDGLCKDRDQVILTGDFNSHHTELGNDHTTCSGNTLLTAIENNHMTLINDGTPTYCNAITGKEGILDLIFMSHSICPHFRDFWVGDDHGSDHSIINGVFSYTPVCNEWEVKPVMLYHKADWLDINFTIRQHMTDTVLNYKTVTKDEIDNYFDKLTNNCHQ